MLSLPVVLLKERFIAVGRVEARRSVLREERTKPLAVLAKPVVLLTAAHPAPVAVLSLPVVLLESAQDPVAVLLLPVVLLRSAPTPVAVLTCAGVC